MRRAGPYSTFQIRDVMNRRLRPEVHVDCMMVNIESNGELHRKALKVSLANIGQVTLEDWYFEIDLPRDVARDTRYPDGPEPHLEALVASWRETLSFVQGPDGNLLLRVSRFDPDDDQRRRRIHPGQTLTLIDPDLHPEIVVEIDAPIWQRVRGKPIAWRLYLPNAQPIAGDWSFEAWCNF